MGGSGGISVGILIILNREWGVSGLGGFVWGGMSEWDGRSEICAKLPPLYPQQGPGSYVCKAAKAQRRRRFVEALPHML